MDVITRTFPVLKEFLQKPVKENEKRRLNMIYNKTESVVIRKMKCPTCELQIADAEIKQDRNLNISEVF